VDSSILKGWAVDGLLRLSSATPLNVIVQEYSPVTGPYQTTPDVVPGQPFWIPDSTQPGRQGPQSGSLCGTTPGLARKPAPKRTAQPYSLDQTDLAVRRRFNLTEHLDLNLRAEYFNVFNHPMFGALGFSARLIWAVRALAK
jgi:hypothetical protein